jgi:predicted Zn-dependent protease
MRNRTWLKRFGIPAVAALAVGCATNPAGRNTLNMIPDSQVNQMGLAAFAEYKTKKRIAESPADQAYIDCVSRNLIAQLPDGPRRLPWEAVLFDDNSPNAFALPGGKIGVNTGLLRVAQSEDQLAAVIGHEIAHVWYGHGGERVSQQFAAQVAGAAVEAYAGSRQDGNSQQVVALLGLGAQVGVLLPFSRKHESEADVAGARLMADAGYAPGEAVTLWENMGREGGPNVPTFLSSHPNNRQRIEQLQQLQPQLAQAAAAAQAAGRPKRCR